MSTERDQIDRNLSRSNHIDGPDTNAWQQFTDARTRQTAERACEASRSLELRQGSDPFGSMANSGTDWAQRERDWRAVEQHERHFGRPGGMTFGRGETTPDPGKKLY